MRGTTDGPATPEPHEPEPHEWARFRVGDVIELHAGKQSRVFRARVDGDDVAVKLTDRRFAERDAMATRLAVVETLAAGVPEVVAPHRIEGELVQSIGGWLMSATPMVEGEPLDLSNEGAGAAMGRTLARVHLALAAVPPQPLPAVAALRATDHGTDRVGWQLLHGDFNDRNVIVSPSGLRVVDFDDCGYGPAPFDLANTLYMVLFDAEINGDPQRYAEVRPALLGGYAAASGTIVDPVVIDDHLATRVDALGAWLDDLTSAPIGIRTSSAEWRDVLRTFVRAHRRAPHER